MMMVSAIVEGHGEVSAVPILLRRIGAWKTPDVRTQILPPIRVHRDRFIRKEVEFSRVLKLAAAKAGAGGRVFILLDADDDCPAELGGALLARARTEIPHIPVSVVLANREYEAWFIAAASSLNGKRGFFFDPGLDAIDAEAERNAKGWVRERLQTGTYGEVLDQPGFSASMDLQQAFDGSRSFRKLCAEWQRLIG
jgi:Domain of unknown function (DUF4276)